MKPGVVSKRDINGKLVLERKMLGVHEALTVFHERCIGCNICVDTCPAEAPSLSSAAIKDGRLIKKRLVDLDARKCTFCGGCVVLCPTDAIQMEINGQPAVRIVAANVFPTLIKKIHVDAEKCNVTCNFVCQDNCPTKAIEVKLKKTENGETRGVQNLEVHLKLCIFCKKCESACPQNAIQVTRPFNGVIKLNTTLCPKGCQVCIDACPSKVISLNENRKPAISEEFCIYCGACQKACPEKVISLQRTQVLHTDVTSGAWITALEKLTSRPYLFRELTSRSGKKLREAAQNIGRF